MSALVKIDQISVTIGKKKIELTVEEAQQLQEALNKVFIHSEQSNIKEWLRCPVENYPAITNPVIYWNGDKTANPLFDTYPKITCESGILEYVARG